MSDLSDESGEAAKKLLEDILAKAWRKGLAGLKDARDTDHGLERARERLKEINESHPDDPWMALKVHGHVEAVGPHLRVAGHDIGINKDEMFLGNLSKDQYGAVDWERPSEVKRRFKEELAAHLGEGARFELKGDYLLFPRSDAAEICAWTRENGYADCLQPVSAAEGEEIEFASVACPDAETAAQLCGLLFDRGITEASRREGDPTVVVVGVSDEADKPAVVACLQECGIGRDAVKGFGDDVLAELRETSERPPATEAPEPPGNMAEAILQSEGLGKTTKAVEREKQARKWSREAPTPGQMGRMAQLVREGEMPAETLAAFDALGTVGAGRNKWRAHLLLNEFDPKNRFTIDGEGRYPREWSREPPTRGQMNWMEGLVLGGVMPAERLAAFDALGTVEAGRNRYQAQLILDEFEPPSHGGPDDPPNPPNHGGPDGPGGDAGPEPPVPETDALGPDEGWDYNPGDFEGEPAGRDVPPGEVRGEAYDDYSYNAGDFEGDAIPAQAPEAAREREYGAKELYTGDRVVVATTYDRANPVGSDGQDAPEPNVAEDDMTAARDEAALVAEVRRMSDEELERGRYGDPPLDRQRDDACAACAAEAAPAREEISIGDPSR